MVGDGVLGEGGQAMLLDDGLHLVGGHLAEHGLAAAGAVHGQGLA